MIDNTKHLIHVKTKWLRKTRTIHDTHQQNRCPNNWLSITVEGDIFVLAHLLNFLAIQLTHFFLVSQNILLKKTLYLSLCNRFSISDTIRDKPKTLKWKLETLFQNFGFYWQNCICLCFTVTFLVIWITKQHNPYKSD